MISQINALDEIAADGDSEDDFGGEWCDEDGDLNLHRGDAGPVHDSQSELPQSEYVVTRPSGIQQLAENADSVEVTFSVEYILSRI